MAAVAAALVVPLLIPGLHVRDLFGHGPGAGGQGDGSLVSLPNPLVQLDQQLHRTSARTILTYHSDNKDPPYLRIYALDLPPTAVSWGLFLQQVTSLGGRPYAERTWASDRLLPPDAHPGYRRPRSDRDGVQRNAHGKLPPAAVSSRHGERRWQRLGGGPGHAHDVVGEFHQRPQVHRDKQGRGADRAGAPRPPAPAPSVSAQELSVPRAYNSLAALARQITSGAVTSYDKAVELQQWFTGSGKFTYSLAASEPNTPVGLEDFLLHSRRGFCQQFAFAFAVLARLLGIPARIAVGYTAGASTGHGNWRVTTSDAHAWPELYFQGAGWLPWEPTPAGAGVGQGTAKAPTYTIPVGGPTGTGGAPGQTSPGSTGQQPGQASGTGVSQHQRFIPDQGAGGVKAAHHNHQQWLWWLLVPAALLLMIALLPLGARLLTRLWRMLIITRGPAPGRSRSRRRASAGTAGAGTAGAGPAGPDAAPSARARAAANGSPAAGAAADAARARIHAAWLEIHDDLEDFGVGCPANESPRALLHRVTAELRLPQASLDALRRVALAEERASYAPSLAEMPALRADVIAVRKAVAASVNLRTRWRARIFPASKLSALRHTSGHALDVFGWIEVATSWLAAHLRPGRREAGSASVR